MRIFLSCLQSRRSHPVPAYQFWETYFKRGIEEGGHEWVEAEGVDWAEGLVHRSAEAVAAWRSRTWESALDQLQRAHRTREIDLFLSYLYPPMVDGSAVAEIRRLGIPTVNFFCDNVREFTTVPAEFRVFDCNWVPELKAVRMYAHEGVRHVHAPMLSWVSPEQRTSQHPETFGVSFIGSRDAQREALLGRALALGADIELRGAGWPLSNAALPGPAPVSPQWGARIATLPGNQWQFVKRYGVRGFGRKILEKLRRTIPDRVFAPHVRPRPTQAEYVHITQQSRVTLGVNRYPSYRYPFDRPDTYSRARDIEAPMMGACYLTEWTEELELMYEIGEEIETYRTPEDLVEKIERLGRDPARRSRMRLQAQRRALSEHSVPRSLQRVATYVGLRAR